MGYEEEEEENVVLEVTGWDKAYIPPAEESKYAISGKVSQVITFSVDNGESIQSEPGTMMYMSNGMKPRVSYEGCWSRVCSGECCYAVNYDNSSDEEKAFLALTPNFPTAKVVPVELKSKDIGGELVASLGAYMASSGEVHVGTSCDCSCTAIFSGTGFIRQTLEGTGTVFLAATGTIVQKVLEDDEVILVDGNCILAFAKSVDIDIRRAGSLVGMVGGGEGIFNTVLTGPGLVLIQSMDNNTFLQAMQANKMYRR